MKVRSGQRYFCGAKGDYEKRRSWARQSSGAILYRLTKAGDSDYGFCLKATFWILEEQLKKMLANSLKVKCARKETHFKSLSNH